MRIKVLSEDIAEAMDHVVSCLNDEIASKGDGAFTSPHEALGVITEEYQEFISAVKSNDAVNFKEELTDIIIASIWAMASKNAFNRTKKSESED